VKTFECKNGLAYRGIDGNLERNARRSRIYRDVINNITSFDRGKICEYDAFEDGDINTREAMQWLKAECFDNTKTIIDIGCGNGLFSLVLAIKYNYHVIGIDGAQPMINLCKELARQNRVNNIEFIELIAENLNSYNNENLLGVAFTMHSLEHFTVPEAVLKGMKTNAKISCGILPNKHANDSNDHIWHWDKYSLYNLLIKVFDSVQVRTYGNVLAFIAK
jgi:2-polyprenyl-3-methyl-5-hydroxy-6-metoxy-1,4-benzoquinol methylase